MTPEVLQEAGEALGPFVLYGVLCEVGQASEPIDFADALDAVVTRWEGHAGTRLGARRRDVNRYLARVAYVYEWVLHLDDAGRSAFIDALPW